MGFTKKKLGLTQRQRVGAPRVATTQLSAGDVYQVAEWVCQQLNEDIDQRLAQSRLANSRLGRWAGADTGDSNQRYFADRSPAGLEVSLDTRDRRKSGHASPSWRAIASATVGAHETTVEVRLVEWMTSYVGVTEKVIGFSDFMQRFEPQLESARPAEGRV